ncbi:MAG TPA: asparagine synthase (glutamine-hydrolyzing) [Gemmatimonadaceae bacterium]|nr:asparagine synthase (glutamine-hydrolyzing) [Gemmatimonadaceae bacterium]
MCGIAGVVGSDERDAAVDRVRRMVRAMAHRGPDGEGIERIGSAVLGHRRLAIFDLSEAGRQPMLSPNGETAIVFNGAIYNFLDLRAELVAAGHRFRSETDTEVLLEGYRAWGLDGLVERLRGMFAFALWDAPAGRLFLVRDRLGVKPLLYARRGAAIAFASTARALRAAGFAEELDGAAVAEFLEYGYVSDERCIYAGVSKLPAATILEWQGGRVSERRYWAPPAPGSAPRLSFDDAVQRTEELLLQAVRRRLHADVPIGALLSGGIDSGLVCWAVAESGGDISAFTVGAPGDASDEADDAADTARELGLEHHVLPLTDDGSERLEDLIGAYAEPFAVESAIGMLRVSRRIRDEGITVLLTGDGGDDVFLGYTRHRHLLAVQRLSRFVPGAATPLWRAARGLIPRRGILQRAVHFTDYVVGGLPAYFEAHDGLPNYRSRGLLGPRLHDATVAERGLPWSVRSARRALEQYLEHDLRHQFVAEYMTKVDGGAMYHALEARSPFLDQELWEFASSLPVETRLQGGELKAILRELARRRIGSRVAGLRKRGFAVPVRTWLTREWRGTVEESFRDSILANEGWTDGPRVLSAFRALPTGSYADKQLWYLFVLEQWLRAERRPVDAAAAPPTPPLTSAQPT